ncbi:ion channel [Jeotgalibacillus proteolyticus]|uniref:ion channel n=1 Tax=Jeotgalibacillus proteolyticus TaxID=2082395 RepID=UPI003CF018EE
MGWGILISVIIITGYAIKRLLTTAWEGQIFSLRNFLLLTVTYAVLLTGFATVFTILTFEGVHVMIVDETSQSFWSLFSTSIYFSAMMLFSVGNGEIIPVGWGRWISILATYLGHALPVTVVWTLMFTRKGKNP